MTEIASDASEGMKWMLRALGPLILEELTERHCFYTLGSDSANLLLQPNPCEKEQISA